MFISDTVMPQLENAANLRRRYADVELLVSCGDLPVVYCEFISTILNVPLFFVRGNHDEEYARNELGGVDLHNNLVEYRGLSFIGLEGSIKYNKGDIQYTQLDMHRMVLKLAPRLRYRRWKNGYGADIFVTHSPAKGIHDGTDYAHQGFDSFLRFMQWYRPRYMVHGHVHTWDRRKTTRSQYLNTTIININPFTVMDIEPVAVAQTQSSMRTE